MGVFVGLGVSVGRGVLVIVGVLVGAGVLVTVAVGIAGEVLVALGTLAVCVAKMLNAILVSVALASGVGGTGAGVADGAHAASTIASIEITISGLTCPPITSV